MSPYEEERSLVERLRHLADARHDNAVLVRLLRTAGILLLIFGGGTVGYYVISNGEHTLLECAYMTVITLTTIGFGETIEVQGHTDRMIFTMFLILVGMGMMLYFVSTLTAFVVDGDLRDLVHSNRMKKRIDNLSDHYILAGLGNTGQFVFQELVRLNEQVLIIESSEERIEDLMRAHDRVVPYIIGDATEDDILEQAGIDRAVGVVFALGSDRDNLFAVVTARGLNPHIRIVTRGDSHQSEKKFKRAGATSVIYTHELSGMRMAAEAMRPEVTTFLELMMQDHGSPRRIEELDLPEGSPIVGKTLREINLRRHCDALIIAILDERSEDYTFNPGSDFRIEAHQRLIVLSLVSEIPTLEQILAGRLV